MPPATPCPGATALAMLVERDQVVTVFSTMDTPEPTAEAAPPPPKKIEVGPIVGGLVGGIVAGLLLVGLVIWAIHHRAKQREKAAAAYERRRRRLETQRRTKSRQSMASSRASSARLNNAPSEKGFDPHVAVPPPRRHTKSFSGPKPQDMISEKGLPPPRRPTRSFSGPNTHEAMSEKGYVYEPQPLAYVPAGGDYYIQQPYEQPSMHPSPNPSVYGTDQDVPQSKTPSPPGSTHSSSSNSSRGTIRVTIADQAALSATSPASSRHRPSRPSPLSRTAEQMPNVDFDGPQPGPSLAASPTSSMSGSSQTHSAYVAAAGGTWGIALGDPEHDPIDFAVQQERALAETRRALDPHGAALQSRIGHRSGQYTLDPFAEYHEYESQLHKLDEEGSVDSFHDAIDFSSPVSSPSK